jgi:hypothetical protein
MFLEKVLFNSLEKNREVDTMPQKDDQEHHEHKVEELERRLQHHDIESVFLVIAVHSCEERIEIFDVVPSGY